jgi:hypothetical protein
LRGQVASQSKRRIDRLGSHLNRSVNPFLTDRGPLFDSTSGDAISLTARPANQQEPNHSQTRYNPDDPTPCIIYGLSSSTD